jgi:Flp pilus assembly pilin Flp
MKTETTDKTLTTEKKTDKKSLLRNKRGAAVSTEHIVWLGVIALAVISVVTLLGRGIAGKVTEGTGTVNAIPMNNSSAAGGGATTGGGTGAQP